MQDRKKPEAGPAPAQGLTPVRFTNLERTMYPAAGITKKDVIVYYIRAAPRMLPFLYNRPLTMHRYPDGVDGEDFYEKDAPRGTPPFVRTFLRHVETADRDVRFVLCDNLDTLLWLANLASLEIHTTLSTADAYDNPDFLLFDIDPEPPLTFDDVIDVAQYLREYLSEQGLRCYVKTSGKKGLHIVVPLTHGHRFSSVRSFAHATGIALAKEIPHVVSELPHSRDPGTIFMDYLQNAHGKTMAAPYSLRATPSATISTPLPWEALHRGVRSEDFNIRTVLERTGEPWRNILDDRQTIG